MATIGDGEYCCRGKLARLSPSSGGPPQWVDLLSKHTWPVLFCSRTQEKETRVLGSTHRDSHPISVNAGLPILLQIKVFLSSKTASTVYGVVLLAVIQSQCALRKSLGLGLHAVRKPCPLN